MLLGDRRGSPLFYSHHGKRTGALRLGGPAVRRLKRNFTLFNCDDYIGSVLAGPSCFRMSLSTFGGGFRQR